ncbi:MAG TPA: GAF domain-containing SpoIIE family protein phosphatase [Acidimicrobiales bacterium]|jgi:serine phosphatase RsbU (regulator of sigma subunit)|nr:GAF domain-containing SpoIIE family protein phosphatase [Acidimicrobiales bacterium]
MADESEHVTAILAALSNVLLSEQTLQHLLGQIADLSCELIEGSAGVGVTVINEGRIGTMAATECFVRAIDEAQYDAGSGPCLDAAARGKLVSVPDIANADRWPQFARAAVEHGVRSSMSLPLTAGDATLGALNIYGRKVGAFADPSDQALASTIAEHAAIAVANAQAFENERRTALILQRSLLPDELPEVPGYQFAVRYQPADATAAVGGDWYDVFVLPGDDHVGLVVGDVMGHGIEAATVMGRLRTAVQAYAIENASPAQVLCSVDKLLAMIPEGATERLATLCYATLKLSTGHVAMANAGHVPPVLVDRWGTVTRVPGPTGPLLGSGVGGGWTETTVEVGPGSAIVFYTDGLIEDRRRPIDEGLDRLQRSLADARGDADAICQRLAEDLIPDERQEDDAAILVVRRRPHSV